MYPPPHLCLGLHMVHVYMCIVHVSFCLEGIINKENYVYIHVLVNCGTCSVCLHVLPSLKQLEDFKTWQAYDDAEENFCELDGKVQLIV